MPIAIRMPQLGESVAEGTVSRWLKRPGEPVRKDEPLVEIVTDKVTAEIPAPADGVLAEILVAEGQTVPVGTEIARLAESQPTAASPSVSIPTASPAGGPRPGFLSPAVRRLLREHGLDPRQIPATGQGGRLTREDVLRYLAAQAATPPAAPAEEEVLPLSPMRRAIAAHLTQAAQTIPMAWLMVEADLTGLVRWREQEKEAWARRYGVPITYLAFVARAAVEALGEIPRLNAVWAGDRIVQRRAVHLGVAVALDDGLVVPVIRAADRLSIVGLARAIHDLAERARTGRLGPEDLQGATFTLNNTGAFGSVLSWPILPVGQAAIMTLERITWRPVVVEGDKIAIRALVNLCLTFDHRVLDGALAGRFLQSVRRRLEAMGPQTALD